MPKLLSPVYTALCAMFLLSFPQCQSPDGPSRKGPSYDSIVMKGSESELKLLNNMLQSYNKAHPGAPSSLDGGGTGTGIDALINGKVNIANASRMISDEETVRAKTNQVNPVAAIIAEDAVAIITHPKVGVDSLSLSELARVFSGKVKNWKELGGYDLPVVIFGRNDQSGTYHYLLSRLNIEAYAPGAAVKTGNDAIVDAVSLAPGAIGYVSLGSIMDAEGRPRKDVWAINANVEGGLACSPYQKEAVKNGDYPLTRPLYQYTNGMPSGKVLEFIRYEISDQQQALLQSQGYFPVTAIHQKLNLLNGFVPL